MNIPNSLARVVFVTRVGCSLCDDAEPIVRSVCQELGVDVDVVDVDVDAVPWARVLTDEVPVVFVDGKRHSYWHVDARKLADALRGPSRRWPGRSRR